MGKPLKKLEKPGQNDGLIFWSIFSSLPNNFIRFSQNYCSEFMKVSLIKKIVNSGF